jgi:hypothetical protein
MSRIFVLAFVAILLQIAQGRRLPESEIEKKYIKIGSYPAHDGSRTKRAADRGAQNVYYMSRTATVWGDAWFECRQGMNGEVLSIETLAEDQFIRDFLIKHGIDNVWTSGAFDANLGIWRWLSNGGQANYLNWLPGYPSVNDASQRIVFQNQLFSYGWYQAPITTPNFHICEQTGEPVPQPTPAPPTTPPPPETTPPAPETTPPAPETTPAPPTTYVHIDPPPELVPQEVTGSPLQANEQKVFPEPIELNQYNFV